MDKITNLFKPGQSKDDEILYGAVQQDKNKGQLGGEGSHFGQHGDATSRTAAPSTGVANTGDASSTTAVKHGIPGESQAATGTDPSYGSQTTQDSALGQRSGHGVSGTERTTLGDKLDPSTRSAGSSGLTSDTRGGTGVTGTQGSTSTPIYDQYSGQRAEPHGSSNAAAIGAAGAGAAGGAYAAGHHHNNDTTDHNASSSKRTADPSLATGVGSTTSPGSHGTTSTTEPTGHSSTTGMSSATTGHGAHNTSSTGATSGLGGSEAQPASRNLGYTGPVHDSEFLNKLDPRVKPVEGDQAGSGVRNVVGATDVAHSGAGSSAYQAPTGTAVGSTSGPGSGVPGSSQPGSTGLQSSAVGPTGGSQMGHDSTLTDRTRSAVPAAVGGAALGSAVGAGAGHHGHSTTQEPTQTGVTGSAVPASAAHDSGASPRYTDTSSSGLPGTSATSGTHPSVGQSPDSQGLSSGNSGVRTGTQTGPIGTAVSTGSGNPYSSAPIDPRVNPHARQTEDSSHHGRDAALGSAALGAAGAGYGAHKHHESSAPSATSGSGYDPQAGTGSHVARESGLASAGGVPSTGHATSTGASQSSHQPSSTTTRGHEGPEYGRGAATGLGAAGVGAGAAMYGLNKEQKPSRHDQAQLSDRAGPGHQQAQSTNQPHDQHHGRDAALGAGAVGAGGAAAYGLGKDHGQTQSGVREPSTTSSNYSQPQTATETHPHHGRDAALGAGATGAGGAAAYGASRDHDRTQPGQLGQSQQTTQDPTQKDHHYGRNAAVGAGAAGAAGAAAYGVDQEAERKRIEKETKEAQKQHDKDVKHDQKAHDKEVKKEQKHAEKEHEKELKKEEKHHQKVVAAEQKKAEKEQEKDVKKHEKEEQKLQHEREKQAAAAGGRKGSEHEDTEQDEHKKKGGLFGFLHRDKHKDDKDEHAHEREGAAAAGVGAAAAGAGAGAHHAGNDDHHERNRLHKDPPESIKREQERHADAPTSGYASQVTGGTGTTALAQGDQLPSGSHATGAGNKLDPAVAGRGSTGEGIASHGDGTGRASSIIKDPHTGLPMDLSKGEHTGRGTDHLPTGHAD